MHDLHVEYVDTGDLSEYHKNPRKGDVGRIAESLDVNGQYKPIVVNRGGSTGRANEVLAGNHTLAGARKLGWDQIACVFVDVTEDEAARIVVVDNRTSDVADNDNDLQAELLDLIGNLEGTGFTQHELDELLDVGSDGIGTNAEDEWEGMPEFESEDHLAWQTVKVHFRNADDRAEFAQLVEQTIGDRTKYVWYPADEKDDVAHLQAVAGDTVEG